MHRIILHKQIDHQWHYVRLSTAPTHAIQIEHGMCGHAPVQNRMMNVPEGQDALVLLQEQGALWLEDGYYKPSAKQLPVMTLHFQMPRWTGYPSGAPWYDDWTQDYLDPITETLDGTCNGVLKSNERFSGNHLYYYSVFNEKEAREAIAAISLKAKRKQPLSLHIGGEEKYIKIPLDPNIPDYLRSLFRTMEKTARLLRDLPAMVGTDPLQPVFVAEPPRRIRGEKAVTIRQILKEKWNFTSNLWDPLIAAAPQETVFLNGITDEKKQAINTEILKRLKEPVFLLDCESGLFEISPEKIFEGAYEGVVFDSTHEWLIYFSHHYTTTFCGEWLINAVKAAYADDLDALNRW
jgi:hypothetical protein